MQLTFASAAETQKFAHQFALALTRPSVVCLSGDLGAGKTQFVRWMLEALNVADVASPTFAIHHSYSSQAGNIDHLDLYRLASDYELEASGFWDLLTLDSALLLVEWADRLPEGVWPEKWDKHFLRLKKLSEESRLLDWTR